MSVLELFVLSTALGADLFSVCIPIGMNRVRLRIIMWSAMVFAVSHIVMILTGYYAGHWLGTMVEHVGIYHIDFPATVVQDWASTGGAVLLAGQGGYMIKGSLKSGGPEKKSYHPLKGVALIMLAVSVSVDALAAGFSMGMLDVDLIKLNVILGTVIFSIALVGLILGRRAGRYIGDRAEMVGGVALILLATHVLWTITMGF